MADPQATVLELSADAHSLRVLEGTGGMKSLDDDDKDNIRQTIDKEVLKGTAIEFRSTGAREIGDRLEVSGELELMSPRPSRRVHADFDSDDAVSATTRIRQTHWGMKPYSALFGTLKVADELTVALDGTLAPA